MSVEKSEQDVVEVGVDRGVDGTDTITISLRDAIDQSQHIRQYESDGILEKLKRAYALVAEIGEHAKTITAAVSGQDDPMRINPNASYPSSVGPRVGAVSGKFLQEFLQAYERLARVLNPVMIPPPKPKPRTIK